VKYCVSGGLGVIGSLIVHSRLEAGDRVVALDSAGSPRHVLNGRRRFRSEANPVKFQFDHLHYQLGKHGNPWADDPSPFVPWQLSDEDRILHAAASTGIPYSGQAPLDDWSRNVDGTLEVLEAVRANPKPLVVLSSVKPYSTASICTMERDDHFALSGSGVNEATLLSPDEPYAASKAAQSLICQAYARSYDLPIVVFRCSNLYGPAAPHGARHGWLTWFCIRAALGWTIEIQGSGKQTRDMLFWSDVESAALLAWEMLEAGKLKGEIFNLGGGYRNMISVLQAVALLRDFGAKFETRSAPGRKHEDALFVTEHSRYTMASGWKPTVGVKDGMRQVYDWACENREALAVVYAEHAPK